MFTLLLLFFCLVTAVYNLPVVPNNKWNLESALGKWYQIADVPQFYEKNFHYCTTAQYELLQNNSVLITNSARNAPSPQATTCVVYGIGNSNVDRQAVWSLSLWPNSCSSSVSWSLPGPIKSTLNWNFVWPQNTKSQYEVAVLSGQLNAFYILTRSSTLSPGAYNAVKKFLANYPNLEPQLQLTQQLGCW